MSRHRPTAILTVALCVVLSACGSRIGPVAEQLNNATGGPVAGGNETSTTTGGGPEGTGPTAGPGPGGREITPPESILRKNCKGGASDIGVSASTIKIGLVAALTGPLPGQFNSEVEAVDSYFKSINDAGGICGRKVELLIRNDNGNRDSNIAVATKLAEEDKIFAFVGSISAPDDTGIARMSKKHKIPDLGFPLTWERTESPYTYGVPGTIQHEHIGLGAGGTTWLNKTYGIKQVAIFWLRESEVSILSAWGFEAAMLKASNNGVTICHEQPSGVLDNNYTNYVVSMAGKCKPENGPLAVYSTMENNANIKLARAMMQQGVKPTVFAPTFTSYHHRFLTDDKGRRRPETEGAFLAMPQVPFERLDQPQSSWTRGTHELKRYVDTLRNYYPRPTPPGSFGGAGWGVASLFAETAAFCGANLTRKCVLDRLESRGMFSANGMLSPNRPGDQTIYTADLIVQVRNGKFVELRPQDKSGPPGGEDFWNDSELFNWGEYFCRNQKHFPDPDRKKALIRAC